MRIVSSFLKKLLYPSLSASGWLHRSAKPGLAVVTYHGVLPDGYVPIDSALDGNLVTAKALRSQLRLLKAHYTVISPEDALAWRKGKFELPPRAVLLTCDDGLRNHLTDMLPVLLQEEMSCLFFVTGASTSEAPVMLWYEELFLHFLRAPAGKFKIASGAVTIEGELQSTEQRRARWWYAVKRLSQVDAPARTSFLRASSDYFSQEPGAASKTSEPAGRRFKLLTRTELCALASSGMTIGAHTLSHPMLSQMPPDLARFEIAESRVRIASALQKDVWAFAYPFGDAQSVSPQILSMPKEAGFDAAFLNFGGGLGVDLPPFALPRLHVTADMSPAEFDAHVSGFHAALQRRTGRTVSVPAMAAGSSAR